MALHDLMRSTPGRFASKVPGAALPPGLTLQFALFAEPLAVAVTVLRAPIVVGLVITMADLGLVPDTELERRTTTPRRQGVLICQACLLLLLWWRPPQSRRAKRPPSSGCDLYLRRELLSRHTRKNRSGHNECSDCRYNNHCAQRHSGPWI